MKKLFLLIALTTLVGVWSFYLKKDSPPKAVSQKGKSSVFANSDIIDAKNWRAKQLHIEDPFVGSGPVLMMAFIDYTTDTSKLFFKESFYKLKSNYFDQSKAKFIVRDFPIENLEQSLKLAKQANCAGEQGAFWTFIDALVEKQPYNSLSKQTCLDSKRYSSEVKKDKAEGLELGVEGTPAFFIGLADSDDDMMYRGFLVRGAQPYTAYAKIIDYLLESFNNR